MAEDCCLFRSFKIYRIRGVTGQFDFVTLPHGSYGYYAANGREAIRLSRQGKEIEKILSTDWAALPDVNPVPLASLVLAFFDEGIKATHQVLANRTSLEVMCRDPRNFQLTDEVKTNHLSKLGETTIQLLHDTVMIRAITLCGWMHRKQNLGVECLKIARTGRVTFEPRLVLSEKTFNRVPGIRY